MNVGLIVIAFWTGVNVGLAISNWNIKRCLKKSKS